jgi:hypothetical protein
MLPFHSIKVLNVTWTLQEVPRRMCADDSWGWIDPETETICYQQGAPAQRLREVILHEVIHAINGAMSLDGAEDEQIASRMSVALMTVMRDNPEFRQWLWP